MKSAGIYLRKGKVYIYSQQETVAGFLMGQGDVEVLGHADVRGIGSKLNAALQAYREGVPTPPRESLSDDFLYAAAGVRGWSEFARGAKAVTVKCENGEITLTPMKNAGRDGFTYLNERSRTIPETSPELGVAVITALADAE